MSIFFIFVYPLRKFITKGIFCEEEVLKMLETNGKWDMLSLAIFVVLGLTMMMIPARWVKLPVQVLLLGGFLAVGQYIVTSEPMYYSDRAFIVFLSWGFALKLFSYFNSNENGSASFWHKVLFFFSPRLIYEGFEE
jgi:signal transduction histidine kinase